MNPTLLQRAFFDNPIVLRDLRATMRGTRAFWFQGVYLFLLGVLAVTGYALSTGQSLIPGAGSPETAYSIVDAQHRLQQFYYFIFVTLAGLITLIAPALTATSVSDERSRQSLDLLTTTPLSATEMLVGKLMSSLAFLGLLLALSLPASALCVLLGGATVVDLFRVYALLAVDAVVLAAVGLYFSCACKHSLHAVIWTYLATIAGTAGGFMVMMASHNSTSLPMTPISAIGMLSPMSAIMAGRLSVVAFGAVKVPLLLAVIPFAFLLVRFLLTAAAYRFGTFGAESGKSLRKQILALTGLLTLIIGYSFAKYLNSRPYDSDNLTPSPTDAVSMAYGLGLIFMAAFVCILPFLPGLFVPVKAEDAPPGATQDAHNADTGDFDVTKMLLPRHAGALPYFYTWLVLAVGGLLSGIALGAGRFDPFVLNAVLLPSFYVAGAGTLVWGLSRLAARFVQASASARALAFGLFVLACALPALPLTLMDWNGTKPEAFTLWLGSPLLFTPNYETGDAVYPVPAIASFAVSGAVAFIVGLGVGLASKPRTA